MSGAVRRTAGYRKVWRGKNAGLLLVKEKDKLLHTENIKHFELHAVSVCTQRMLSGRVLKIRLLPQNRLHADLSHS